MTGLDNKDDKRADTTDSAPTTAMEKKRKRRSLNVVSAPWILAICAVLALGGAAVTLFGTHGGTRHDAGATVSDYRGMTRDEIQAELDKTVRDNMMTVSVAARASMNKQGIVRINAINDSSNTFAQRYSLIQDNRVLYESGAVDPGNAIESCHVEGIHEGEALIEVQAVDTDTLEDHGSPTRVKVSIIAE